MDLPCRAWTQDAGCFWIVPAELGVENMELKITMHALIHILSLLCLLTGAVVWVSIIAAISMAVILWLLCPAQYKQNSNKKK